MVKVLLSLNQAIYLLNQVHKVQSMYSQAGIRHLVFVTEDLVIQTMYLGTPRKFIYTFYDDDQTTIIKQIVGSYGDQIIQPTVENKLGGEGFDYAFDGWDRVVPEKIN